MPELFRATTDKPTNIEKTPEIKSVEVKPKQRHRMLSAFMIRPDGVRFETQEDQEEILLFMRAHPITNVRWIVATLILLIVPMILLPLLAGTRLLPSEVPPGYYIVLPLVWYLGVFGFAFTNFLHWYFNVYIVTNQRVVDIDWINLLYKQLASAQLARIQDVTYKQGGILDSFFNFGNVFIQTAGTEPNFEFESVPKPDQLVREIDRIIEEHAGGGK